MAKLSQKKSGLPQTEYYAPNYKIEIEGKELSPESKGDVLGIKVTMDMENLASFQLTINNWDAAKFDFKYSDTATFDVGKRVHVQMGYADRLVSMVRGQITTLSPRFPESGSPIMTINGLDGMVKLRDRRPKEEDVTKYVNKADWEIAQVVAQRNGLKVKVTQEGEKHPEVVQKNQDDAQFLMERAKRIDFDCFVLTDQESGEDTLHFVKPTDGRDASSTRVYQLEWGKNLINFTPTMNLSRQVGSITVRGWNPRTKSAIKYTATAKDLPGASKGGTSGPQAAEKTMQGKQDAVVDAPIASEQEAKDLAISLLRERAYEFITGSGQIIGLPDLRPGDNLEISGLGKRFSGEYYVKKVDHSIGDSGYKTQFDVRKIYDGGI